MEVESGVVGVLSLEIKVVRAGSKNDDSVELNMNK